LKDLASIQAITGIAIAIVDSKAPYILHSLSVKEIPMTMQCALTGAKPGRGNKYARRGKAKYLGGVGRKVTGKTKRRFKPNLQRVKIIVDGKVKTVRVTVKAIRSGLAKRPVKRKPFQMPTL